jgi:hypothetical protein
MYLSVSRMLTTLVAVCFFPILASVVFLARNPGATFIITLHYIGWSTFSRQNTSLYRTTASRLCRALADTQLDPLGGIKAFRIYLLWHSFSVLHTGFMGRDITPRGLRALRAT